MIDLRPGDRIEIAFADALEQSARATVNRFLSDQQEGLSPEAETYVACWMEITPDHPDLLTGKQTISFCVDWKYYLDGREVRIQKCSQSAS